MRKLFAVLLFITIPVIGNEVHYVICKDSEGVLRQAKGERIVIDGDSVFVYNDGRVTQIIIGIQCWTENETVKPKGKDRV